MNCQVKIRGQKAIDYPCQDIDFSGHWLNSGNVLHYQYRVRVHKTFIGISMSYVRKRIVVMRIVVKRTCPQCKYMKLLANPDSGNVVVTPI